MKKFSLLAILLTACGALHATPFLVADGFNVAGSSDVIGDKLKFDIQRAIVTLDTSMVTVKIQTNFDNVKLDPFQLAGLQLDLGDVLFEVNGKFKYGVPLRTHAGSPDGGASAGTVTAGHIYQINDLETGVFTARQVLNNPSVTYRPDNAVWLRNQDSSLLDLTSGIPIVQVAALPNNGVNGAKYEITAQFNRPEGFQDVNAIYFAVATCGNDILEANLVPEPASVLLMGGGLGLVALARRYRNRSIKS